MYKLKKQVVVIDKEYDGICKAEVLLAMEQYDLDELVEMVVPLVKVEDKADRYSEEEIRSEIYKDIATVGKWSSASIYSDFNSSIAGLRLKVRYVVTKEKEKD